MNDNKRPFLDSDAGEPMQFIVTSEREGVGKKSGTPYIMLGLRCTATDGKEVDVWVNHFFNAKQNPNQMIKEFSDYCGNNIHVSWSGDHWDGFKPGESFKYSKGLCTVKKSVKGEFISYNVDKFIKPAQDMRVNIPEVFFDSTSDEDLPF